MLSVRKALFAAAVALAVAPSPATAGNFHGSPFMSQPHQPHLGPYLFANHNNRQLPAFQAAPWYLYWPYDGHFLTPAPVHAPFYGPPTAGNFPVNPYFPAPGGYYGPYPGGPAPGGVGPGAFVSYPPPGIGPVHQPGYGPVAQPGYAPPTSPVVPPGAPIPVPAPAAPVPAPLPPR
jgi:hypothetical protein